MSIHQKINTIMTEHVRRSAAARKARLARITAEVAEQNEGKEPTFGSSGRFHAPCDGYHYDDGQRDGTYMAGEYLPIPFDDEECPSDRPENFGPRETLRITRCCAERANELVSDLCNEWTDHSYAGQEFEAFGVEACHVYLRGKVLRSKAAVAAVTEYLQAPLKAAADAEERRRQSEHERAEPCPEGRTEISGRILTIRNKEGWYGEVVYKMLVQDDRGFKVWGTRPLAIEDADRGDRVKFTATIEQSDDDEKFGFFKRPAKAVFEAAPEAA